MILSSSIRKSRILVFRLTNFALHGEYDGFLDKGIALIEAGEKIGGGSIKQYNHLMSNSHGCAFFDTIKGLDIIAGFTLRTPLMFKLDWYITELMKDKRPNFLAYKENKTKNSMYGSNVIAVAPSRSADKSTRIAINSHQPWEGPVTWYEAHLHSDEGWNASGGLFPGSPVILKGYNENISWSHTVNKPDLVDVYELTINPENKYQYQLDDNWTDFEVSQLPIRVKLFGPFYWTVKREILYSKHGPVIETNHGTYAVRYSGHGLIGQVEQLYNINKSLTLEEFQKAMKMMEIPMFNTMFADKYGNIFYIYNALLPKRKNGINWKDIVPVSYTHLTLPTNREV